MFAEHLKAHPEEALFEHGIDVLRGRRKRTGDFTDFFGMAKRLRSFPAASRQYMFKELSDTDIVEFAKVYDSHVVAAGASLPAQAGGMVDKEQAQAWVMEATESYAFALQAAGKACASNTKLAFVSGGTGYTGVASGQRSANYWPISLAARPSSLGLHGASLYADPAIHYAFTLPWAGVKAVGHHQPPGLRVVGCSNFQTCKDHVVELLENAGALQPVRQARKRILYCQILGARGIGKSICLAMTVQDLMFTIESTPLLKSKVRVVPLLNFEELVYDMEMDRPHTFIRALLDAHGGDIAQNEGLTAEIVQLRSFKAALEWICKQQHKTTYLCAVDAQEDPLQSPGAAAFLEHLAQYQPVLVCLSAPAVENAGKVHRSCNFATVVCRLSSSFHQESFQTILQHHNLPNLSAELKDKFAFLSGCQPLLVDRFLWQLSKNMTAQDIQASDALKEAKFKAELDYWAKDRELAELLRGLQDWVHDRLLKRNGAEDIAALLTGGQIRMQAKDFDQPLLTIDEHEKTARLEIGIAKMAAAAQMFEDGKILWAASTEFLQALQTLHQSGGSRAAMEWMAAYAVQACLSENEQAWDGLPKITDFEQPPSIVPREKGATLFLPITPTYPHLDIVTRTIRARGKGAAKALHVDVRAQQITLSPENHQHSRPAFMASHMAGRWAEGNTQLRIPITPAYTFAWVVPKCKIGDVDIQQVPGTATMVAHRVHWTCFGAISPKLAFLDVDPATAAGK